MYELKYLHSTYVNKYHYNTSVLLDQMKRTGSHTQYKTLFNNSELKEILLWS